MKIHSIHLDSEEEVESITVTMTAREMVFIATVVGRMNDHDGNAVFPGGGSVSSEIYGALSGGVANRFWEDGLADALREQGGVPSTG